MSQENVADAERAMDAFNGRDIDASIQPTTADFEWFPALGMAVEAAASVDTRGRHQVPRRPGHPQYGRPIPLALAARLLPAVAADRAAYDA
jgi:hypothetical protein